MFADNPFADRRSEKKGSADDTFCRFTQFLWLHIFQKISRGAVLKSFFHISVVTEALSE